MRAKLIAIGVASAAIGFAWGVVTMKFHTFPYVTFKQQGSPTNVLPIQLAAARTAEKYPRKADIVFIGDSIFALVQWPDLFPDKRVTNHAVAGFSTQNMLDRVDAVNITGAPIAVMLAGINDIVLGVPEGQTLKNVAAMRDRFHGKLYVVSLTPCSDDNADCGKLTLRIQSMNSKLAHLPGIRFIDINSHMSGADIADGIHPNANGIDKIIAGVRDALR